MAGWWVAAVVVLGRVLARLLVLAGASEPVAVLVRALVSALAPGPGARPGLVPLVPDAE